MSIWLSDVIEESGRTPEELLELFPGYRLCWLTADDAYEFNQSVRREEVSEFPGHAVVVDPAGRRSQTTRSKLAGRARWYVATQSPCGEAQRGLTQRDGRLGEPPTGT